MTTITPDREALLHRLRAYMRVLAAHAVEGRLEPAIVRLLRQLAAEAQYGRDMKDLKALLEWFRTDPKEVTAAVHDRGG